MQGYRHFRAEEQGQKVRLRPESFADHYSQTRQFYVSQTPPEQRHIAAALTFELSKVESAVIPERMVSHLLNIDGRCRKNRNLSPPVGAHLERAMIILRPRGPENRLSDAAWHGLSPNSLSTRPSTGGFKRRKKPDRSNKPSHLDKGRGSPRPRHCLSVGTLPLIWNLV